MFNTRNHNTLHKPENLHRNHTRSTENNFYRHVSVKLTNPKLSAPLTQQTLQSGVFLEKITVEFKCRATSKSEKKNGEEK
jgi:thiamine phosphate synthase YjbQ (UPF0047 family)